MDGTVSAATPRRTVGAKEDDWDGCALGISLSATDVLTRFNKAGARMRTEDDAGGLLEEVNRIHPVVDRLRRLLQSAFMLDLKATADGYWGSVETPSDRRRHPGEDLAVQ